MEAIDERANILYRSQLFLTSYPVEYFHLVDEICYDGFFLL